MSQFASKISLKTKQKGFLPIKDNKKKEGVDRYKQAIKSGKIVYTCNCGWVDTTHAFESSKRKFIGASSLWEQILNETGLKSNSPKEKGFKVTYRQDAAVSSKLPTVGVTNSYFVKENLSLQQKEQVALAIFQEVSMEFEQLQSWGWIIGRGDSSFEPADLVSNMLGFYMAVKGLTKEQVLKLCEPLTAEQSLKVYEKYPGTFTDEKYKNKKFTPRFFPNDYCTSPKFPKEFQSIQPAIKGTNFRDWMPLFDIHGGKPPLTGPKW